MTFSEWWPLGDDGIWAMMALGDDCIWAMMIFEQRWHFGDDDILAMMAFWPSSNLGGDNI